MDHGWDVKWLRLFFPKLPAHDLEVIIKRLYDSAGIVSPAFFNYLIMAY